MNTIDVISIAPFYFKIFLSTDNGGYDSFSCACVAPGAFVDGLSASSSYMFLLRLSRSSSAIFRIVRLVRVFRVFKLSRYLTWVKVFAAALRVSLVPLGMLLIVVCIGYL